MDDMFEKIIVIGLYKYWCFNFTTYCHSKREKFCALKTGFCTLKTDFCAFKRVVALVRSQAIFDLVLFVVDF